MTHNSVNSSAFTELTGNLVSFQIDGLNYEGYVTKIYELPGNPQSMFSNLVYSKIFISVSGTVPANIYIYIYVYMYIHTYIYIKSYCFLEIEREGERERETQDSCQLKDVGQSSTDWFSGNDLSGTVPDQFPKYMI